MYLVLGRIPPNDQGQGSEESQLIGHSDSELPRACFYIDDMFLWSVDYKSVWAYACSWRSTIFPVCKDLDFAICSVY
jgi:hypothetical protein